MTDEQNLTLDRINRQKEKIDDCFTVVQDTISDIPTADVAEVVRGKWIGESLECSACKRSIREIYDAESCMSYGIEDDLHYCPFCGAKITERI